MRPAGIRGQTVPAYRVSAWAIHRVLWTWPGWRQTKADTLVSRRERTQEGPLGGASDWTPCCFLSSVTTFQRAVSPAIQASWNGEATEWLPSREAGVPTSCPPRRPQLHAEQQ